MAKYNPMLMCDFYKCVHAEQYPTGMKVIASPYTPRMSRLKDVDKVTYFGGQAFIKEYLIDTFNKYFFNVPEEEVLKGYTRIIGNTLGKGTCDYEKIRKLHRLGYLPIAVFAVPEGSRTAIGVPQSVFVNTHPDFAWVTNALETLYSCYMWHTQVSAEVGIRYRNIVQKWVDKTCANGTPVRRMLGDFSMRGQHSPESATKSSAAWLLSFVNTATVPSIMWLEENYNCDCENEEVGFGAISTEHSVMCSNAAVDGDEITHIKRLLTEIYPNHNFSMVSDSYDYWNLVTNLLPQCRKEIMEHNGTLLVRGDSGDPVEIIAGKPWIEMSKEEVQEMIDDPCTAAWDWNEDSDFVKWIKCGNKYYKFEAYTDMGREYGAVTDRDYYFIDSWGATMTEVEPTAEVMGTVWALDQNFGHSINEKGYKVLDPHIKAIYGDSMTPQRVEEAYRRLEVLGYAANNVVFGVGSFSFMCLETFDNDGTVHYNPYTRDTFGIAIKATYGEDENNKPVMIHKQPKECSWKKSQKGCVVVAPDGMSYTDGYTLEEMITAEDNLMRKVFENGYMVEEYSLAEIRKRLWGEF